MTPIIVALDYAESRTALDMARRLDPARCRVKVGKELFTRVGPAVVEDLMALGFDVFLDLKFHDIPNTVAGACRAAAELGVWMINVHTLGGRRMMEAAREAVDSTAQRPLLIGVTILTSMSEQDISEVGLAGTPEANVTRLAELAAKAGLDGVVCSPREVELLRAQHGRDFSLVTPGIRPSWAAKGDQRRVMTPSEALQLGTSYLVIGRPITGAEDPLQALSQIENEIQGTDKAQ